MSEDDTTAGMRDARAANLFDLRRIIGGVFVVLGVLLAVLGLFDSQEEIDRAAGVNINLWAGLGMLVLGLLFVAWALLRPLSEEIGSEQPSGGTWGDGEGSGGHGGAGGQQRQD
jgi:xanthine/uracil/vitamin C permease (AzgA family)